MSLVTSSAQSSAALPLNLVNSFPLRSLLPRWRFDGAQQDSAEFLQGFLTAASDLPLTRRWATVDQATGRLEVEGGPLVMLMQHSESRSLQSLIDEWALVPPNTTLLGQQKHAVFTVARFTGSGKNHFPITSYGQELRVPVLYQGLFAWNGHTCNPAYFTLVPPRTAAIIAQYGGQHRHRSGSRQTITADHNRPRTQITDKPDMAPTSSF